MPATGSDYGGAGLIEMRNARFRPDGMLEAGTALRHQRRFWFLSFQALPFLEATFRLTDRLNATTGHGTTTDRAFDLKLRLWEEGPWRPALALGVQDMIGTGLYAGEYLVASKRFWGLDMTLGLGWGRLGTGGDLRNPLGALSDRFLVRPRQVGEGGTPALGSLFRGREIAVFGGLEYSLPWVEGLRAKLEWSGDALRDERGGYPGRSSGLRGEARSRLNLGLQWQPNPWVDAGVHFLHGSDLLLRLSLRLDPTHPPELPRPAPPPVAPRPAVVVPPEALTAALRRAGFRPVGIILAGTEVRIAVAGGRFPTLAQVAGRVARIAQPLLPPEVERLAVEWHRAGLPVARFTLLRQAMEAAAIGRGSAEEVLASATLDPAGPFPGAGPDLAWTLGPRLAVQLGDPREGLLWQAGLAAGLRLGLGSGFALAGSVAQALAGNLEKSPASDSLLPHVRSDLGRYARGGGPPSQHSMPSGFGRRRLTGSPGSQQGYWNQCSAACPVRSCGGRSSVLLPLASTSPGLRSGTTGSGLRCWAMRSPPAMPRSMPTCRCGT